MMIMNGDGVSTIIIDPEHHIGFISSSTIIGARNLKSPWSMCSSSTEIERTHGSPLDLIDTSSSHDADEGTSHDADEGTL